jgi:alanine or glycine:cation symporter, AGCS family
VLASFFTVLDSISGFLWAYPAIILIAIVGLYFTIYSKLVQIRGLPQVVRAFFGFLFQRRSAQPGIHPLAAFFASIGGAIGVGNVVVICAAIQIGGPGALFWTWVTAFLGMTLKYSEVYLGMRYRIRNQSGSYDGGPMYYLPKAYGVKWIATLAAILLCVYGVEIFLFSELTASFETNWGLSRYIGIPVLLALVLGACLGGIGRVGKISSALVPLFVVLYLGMSLWVIGANFTRLPEVFSLVMKSAFTGHAPLGAFGGASWLLAMSQGAARGCYSGDIGVGYTSVIESESRTLRPARQASLAILGIFLDTLICSLSVGLVLITGVWTEQMPTGGLVQAALGRYFPHMHLFMPFFLFLLGYSTLIAYFVVGMKCAKFLLPRHGKTLYIFYGSLALVLFGCFESYKALVVMTFTGALLLLINVVGFFLLRKEVRFELDEKQLQQPIA